MKGTRIELRPKRIFILSSVGLVLVAMLVFIVFGENGLRDLHALRVELGGVLLQNEKILDENISLYRQVERLQNDPEFIEATARKELGVIGADELIIKLKQNRE
jgi:cell division protein FtsB